MSRQELAMPPEPSVEAKKSKKPEKYEIESAARTLMEAEDIKRNKHLMPHVHAHLKKQVKSIKSVQELRERSKEMQDDNDGDE